jgi:hypothetical protein
MTDEEEIKSGPNALPKRIKRGSLAGFTVPTVALLSVFLRKARPNGFRQRPVSTLKVHNPSYEISSHARFRCVL